MSYDLLFDSLLFSTTNDFSKQDEDMPEPTSSSLGSPHNSTVNVAFSEFMFIGRIYPPVSSVLASKPLSAGGVIS